MSRGAYDVDAVETLSSKTVQIKPNPIITSELDFERISQTLRNCV